MKRIFLSILVVGLLLLGACTPSSTAPLTETPSAPVPSPTPVSEPAIPAHFTTYTDEAGFFSISYPPEWRSFPSWSEELGVLHKDFFKGYDSDTSLAGLFFVFIAEAPRDSGGSSPNVNIVVQALSDMTSRGWLTLDEIVEAKLQRTEEIKEEYRELSRINTIIDGREAVIIDWESSTSELGKKARSVQMFLIADNLVWKVTSYVDSEKLSDFEDDLRALVRSLRILR